MRHATSGARLLELLVTLSLGPLVWGSAGCRAADTIADTSETLSPNARPETLATLREDLIAPRHPSDGGGRAWLDGDVATVAAGSTGRFTLLYEAGPLGISSGGMLFLQVSPFWGWSTPQVFDPEAPGYTTVESAAAGVELEADTFGEQLLGIRIGGRPLAQGERVRIVYGAGPLGAQADRFAERGSRFWFSVDGDGDGVRRLLADSPAVDVVPGPPALLVLTLPTTAQPGDHVRLTLAVLDDSGNSGLPIASEVLLDGDEERLVFPRRVELEAEDRGRTSVEVAVRAAGVLRLEGEASGLELRATSNPIVSAVDAPRILWADLHGHSNFSDGTGTPEDYFVYARDVAALDVIALTDHDHWGMRPLAHDPELWSEIRRQTQAFHVPGRFVTLLGYEWTSWLHGHRHVLYFHDQGEVLSSVDENYESPLQLWDALRGKGALTFAHHSAGGPIATNWAIPPDPELEPVTEVASVHGASEAPDAPAVIYQPVAGNFVRDALDRGYRLGFIGSGDSHDGHPGLAHLASPSGGLAAIASQELTREGVLATLRGRRTYATNGPRIFLDTRLEGRPMGAQLEAKDLPRVAQLEVWVVSVESLERLDVIRSGSLAVTQPSAGIAELRTRLPLADLESGEYVYVRAVQTDGGAAWSSPYFVQ